MLAVQIDLKPTRLESPDIKECTVQWLKAITHNGDREAFEKLYQHFAPKIKKFMMRQGADVATADDLAQETMAQVWCKASQYNPERAAPAAWIYTVARNLRIDKLRRQKFHEVELTAEADKEDEGLGGHEAAVQNVDAHLLREQIRTLPDEQLEVIQLAFFEGLSHSEVGARLSVPLGTVKSRLRLAFGKLRIAMGEKT
jgi:RNA polymerase sigma-70 factor (ECF subfamily)